MTQDVKKITKGSRPKRTPVGQKGRLTVTNKSPDKEYRFVNDRDSRVQEFEQNGWTVELAEDHQVGDRRVEAPSTSGSAARIPVGLGDHAVLMSIPKEWYEEDQRAKAERVDATEQTIKENVSAGYKGKFEVSRG